MNRFRLSKSDRGDRRPLSSFLMSTNSGNNLMGELVWIVVALLSFPLLAFPDRDRPDQKAQAHFAIELDANTDGSFRLTTTQAPLQQIVERIAEATNTVLNYPPLPGTLATVSCSGMIIELMKCVLGDTRNLMMRYGPELAAASGTESPAEIWVLAANGGPSATDIEPRASGKCGSPQSDTDAESGGNDSGKTPTLSPQEQHALVERVRSRDLPARTEAITRLARGAIENDPEVLAALQEALADEHSTIRAQAASTLAARNSAGADPMLRQAFLDPDANVRLTAVGYAGDDEVLLSAALHDADKNVRLLAKMNLEQLHKQDSADH